LNIVAEDKKGLSDNIFKCPGSNYKQTKTMKIKKSRAWKYAAIAAVLFLSVNVVKAQKQPATKAQASQTEKKQDDAQGIINDLLKAKVISADKKSNLTFKLNYDELIVNNKKMTAGLHDELRHKYLQGNPRKTISFKREVN
jgi:hypothetical protein